MVYVWAAVLAVWLATAGWGWWNGHAEYKRGREDCNNEWVAQGAAEKAMEKARNEAAAEQSAADAKAVAARIAPLADAIRRGRESAGQPVKVVAVFPPGCKVSAEVVADANR